MLSLKDQSRLNAIRYAWRNKPQDFTGPEYYAGNADALLKWPHSIRNGNTVNSFPRLVITADELNSPDTEPLGLFYRYSFFINDPTRYGFTERYYTKMSIREYVVAYTNKLYVGLGTPSIAELIQQHASPHFADLPAPIMEIFILGEINQ